jgi:flagellar hook-basal body complex protein FliE
MAISPIGAGSGITPIQFPSLDRSSGVEEATGGGNFGDKMADAVQNLQDTQKTADSLAMEVASGGDVDIHDYMIASNQAQVATQLTVAVRNKAVESFQQIMNMQV